VYWMLYPRARIHPDKFVPLPHFHWLKHANRLAPTPLRAYPDVVERLNIGQSAPVQNRQLQVIHLDDHVIDAHADQCGEQMFRCLDQHALPHQARRVADFRYVPSNGRNLKVIEIRPPENDPRPRRRRQHPHRHRRARVQPPPLKTPGRLQSSVPGEPDLPNTRSQKGYENASQ